MDFLKGSTGRSLVREGAFDAVKIGAAESYLGAFGVFLGGTPLQIGALATLPPLFGAMLQTIGVKLVERVQSRRTVLSYLMHAQGVLLLPIALLPFFAASSHQAVILLIALTVLYQATIGIIAPVWSSLAGDLIPAEARGQFFGYRNRTMSVATFLALLAAGEVIHQFSKVEYTALGFLVVFMISGFARVLSALAFKGIDDPPLHVPEDSKFTFWQFISRVKYSNFVRFVLFVSTMNFAVAVAGPFFAMYMLKDLALSYMQYTTIIASAVVAQFVVIRAWGRLSDQFGSKKILKVCGWMVATNPIWWLVSDQVWFLVLLQCWSGFFWAGFSLAAANFVFDAVSPPKRARCIAYQGIVNGVLVCAGSITGGVLVTYLPHEQLPHVGLWVPNSPFLILFSLSGLIRLIVMSLLFPAFREVRAVQRIRSHEILIRVSSLRPMSGATFAFVSGRGRFRGRGGVDGDKPVS